MALRVIIAGGGTGGHVIPAIAIARELVAAHGAEVLFVGTSRGMENRLVPAAGFQLRQSDIGTLKNAGLLKRLKTLFTLPRAIVAAARLISEFKPQVVVGVGGYASGPMMAAAILRRIPTVIFEANFVPGLANRVVARFVDAAAVHFEQTGKYFKNAKVTGVPVRREFFAIKPSDEDQRVLFVTGGSQGAQAINRAVMQMAPVLRQEFRDLLIVHQTGEKDLEEVRSAYSLSGLPAEVSAFIDDMPKAFARAHLLICRSGASTVAEITAAGKVALFIPFPHAADDHQLRNAQALANKGAAIVLEQKDLTPERLLKTVGNLFRDDRLPRMAEVSRKLSHPNAAQEIGAMIAAVARGDRV